MKRISLILPTLNEEANISSLIAEINRTLKPSEIIVIDDMSADNTVREVEKSAFSNTKLVVNRKREGLARSIDKGIRISKYPILCWMDADFSHPPAVLPKMYGKILEHDAVIGSWLVKGGSDLRRNGLERLRSKIMDRLCKIAVSGKISSYTSGFIMIRKKVLKGYSLEGYYGEYFIYLWKYLLNKGVKYFEIPFSCKPRKSGKSKTASSVRAYSANMLRYIKAVFT